MVLFIVVSVSPLYTYALPFFFPDIIFAGLLLAGLCVGRRVFAAGLEFSAIGLSSFKGLSRPWYIISDCFILSLVSAAIYISCFYLSSNIEIN